MLSSGDVDENDGVARCCVGVTVATADDGVDDGVDDSIDGDIPRGLGGSRYGGGAHRGPVIIHRYLSINVNWRLAAPAHVQLT